MIGARGWTAPLPRRTALAALGAAAGAAAGGSTARAQQEWPTAPVRYINLFPPGGGSDLLIRSWCARMGELAGQQFVVEYRTGSGGNVGTQAIARAPADGYTVGLGSVASLAIAPTLYASLPFDAERDFTYIAGIWQLPNMLVVNNEIPARTVPELIDLVRRRPGHYSFASAGSGTTIHLAGEMFKHLAGLDMLHVPYRGATPAYVDLVAGRVHMMFDNIPQALARARDGNVRPLAATGAERSPQAPEIPTMAEFLPGYEITSWGSVVGPAGMPAQVVERISALAKRALETPELRRLFVENGATPWWTTPADLIAFRRAQEARFAPLIRASGARVE